jgi:phosphoglycolate phosphatase
MTRAVLFDVDGTLVSYTFDVVGTRMVLIGELTRLGFDVSALNTTSLTQLILDAARSQIDAGRVNADYKSVKSHFYSILDGFEEQSAREARPLDGVHETLGKLQGSVRLGVLTNSGRRATNVALRRAGLVDYFDIILTRDDVPEMKPRSDGLRKAVSMLSVSGSDVLYVGDSVSDIKAARSAGVKVASVVTGSYSAEKLRLEGPDYLIYSIREVPDLISARNQAHRPG